MLYQNNQINLHGIDPTTGELGGQDYSSARRFLAFVKIFLTHNAMVGKKNVICFVPQGMKYFFAQWLQFIQM